MAGNAEDVPPFPDTYIDIDGKQVKACESCGYRPATQYDDTLCVVCGHGRGVREVSERLRQQRGGCFFAAITLGVGILYLATQLV